MFKSLQVKTKDGSGIRPLHTMYANNLFCMYSASGGYKSDFVFKTKTKTISTELFDYGDGECIIVVNIEEIKQEPM